MLPDPIERAEDAAERAYDALELPDGRLQCWRCSSDFDPQTEGGTISPDPCAMPVCGACLQEEMEAVMKAGTAMCGLCHGIGSFSEYGDSWPCPACSSKAEE